MQKVILVDENGNRTGEMGKIEAHEKGLLHLAVSVFVFTKLGNMILQQRAKEEYHSGLLWSNTACTHIYTCNKDAESAAAMCLDKEMGLRNIKLVKAFDFIYKTEVSNGLIEHELDCVFIGFSEQKPEPNPYRVMGFEYKTISEVYRDIKSRPYRYTKWLQEIMLYHLPSLQRAIAGVKGFL